MLIAAVVEKNSPSIPIPSTVSIETHHLSWTDDEYALFGGVK